MRVLTVDDDEICLEMLNRPLADAGYDLVSASNGREAIAALATSPCRIVITDWEMPEMNGLDLCRAIRAQQWLSGYVYIIFLTANNRREDAVTALSAGADDFIGKPFDHAEVLMRVKVAERILALETRDMTIFALAKLAESRDPETGQHLERTRNYCRLLAERLFQRPGGYDGMDANYAAMIYLTSPLHDIGKVGIPDTILLKPARLSEQEFEIMKHHTAIGAEALSAALDQFPEARFLRMARDIAASHHERFDGTGYPSHLVGHNIPLCGRITALADVYDALTSRRVYKDAIEHTIAKAIIIEESGSHFDPRIVAAFLDTEEEIIETRERFAEPAMVSV